jgi:hypothetical protein
MKQGESIKSKCGRYRIMYDPAWDSIRPFKIYINGTAGPHAMSLDAALGYFRKRGANPSWGE